MSTALRRWKLGVVFFLVGLTGCDVVGAEHRSGNGRNDMSPNPGSSTGGHGQIAAAPGNIDPGTASASGRGAPARTGSGTLAGE